MPTTAGSAAHPKWLKSVSVHRNQPLRRTAIAALFALGYALTVSYAVSTAGEPYVAAKKELERLEALKNETNGSSVEGDAPEQLQATASVAPTKAEAAAPPARQEWGVEWEEDDWDAPKEAAAAPATPPPTVNITSSANISGGNLTATPRPLPHEWLPSALACALLFLLATAHALFYLLCHWSVAFKTRVLFSPAREVGPGSYLCFVPYAHKGRPAIVYLTRSAFSQQLTCEFQRQKFELLPSAEVRGREDAKDIEGLDEHEWAVALIRCPDHLPVNDYVTSRGLADDDAVKAREDQFGVNMLSVPTPRFIDMYIEQLLSPLAMFQIFTSVLWLLDSVSYGFSAFQVSNLP